MTPPSTRPAVQSAWPLSRPFALLLLSSLLAGCGGTDSPAEPGHDPSGEQEPEPPGPGPWFSVTPIPLDRVVRITPLGHNNKTIPVGHTYWDTCDIWALMPSGRCERGKLPIRAPRDAVVRRVDPQADGTIVLEGPPRLDMIFGHVTPTPGLARGDSVRAGDVVATMYYDHGFDFGVEHFGLEPHPLLRPDRAPVSYLHTQSPIAQYPEPVRSRLIERVQTLEDPLGRIAWDVAGTAQGLWFQEGTPDTLSYHVQWVRRQLFMGPLQERHETRILTVGAGWGDDWGGLSVLDPSAPDWDAITPSTGAVTLRMWNLTPRGTPNFDFPRGTYLLEMVDGETLRLEWFAGHDEPTEFTAGARVYER